MRRPPVRDVPTSAAHTVVRLARVPSGSARRGGTFPELEVFRIIDGQADLSAHGPRHMPVWGYEFYGEDLDDEAAHRQSEQKVERLVNYLRSLQRTD